MNFVGSNSKNLSFVLTVKVVLEGFLENVANLNNTSHLYFGSSQNIRFCQKIFMFSSVNKFAIFIRSVQKEISIH